ncbi:MAG: hypothetical protein HY721_17030 [Planctomycetes bacterium]|nr:hypothetical protein [Planctomycetota bacterium]
MQLVLSLTVLRRGVSIRKYGGVSPNTFVLGGQETREAPLPLTNGRFLSYSATLFLDPETKHLKVSRSRFQYQLDKEGARWIFRYEYLRDPEDKHPAAHLHVRGTLAEDCLPPRETLEHLHFPTHRVPLEAVIRLLVDHFKVPCNEQETTWRPVLLESEVPFVAIAHPPTNLKQGGAP